MLLYNVENPIEKREQQESPGPDQLEVPPPGVMTASDGKLNGGIVTSILMYFCTTYKNQLQGRKERSKESQDPTYYHLYNPHPVTVS